MADKTQKAYGKSFPDDEIGSIMGRATSPEWTVNILALVKEPWRFKDLEDQLNMYPQQGQADQQKKIIAKISGKMPDKSRNRKRKKNERNHHNNNGGRSITRQGITIRGGRGGRRGGRGSNISEHLKTIEYYNCGKKVTILPTAPHQERMTLIIQTWYPKRISKIYFNLL
jgi:hypothetical protein